MDNSRNSTAYKHKKRKESKYETQKKKHKSDKQNTYLENTSGHMI
jgi:hypothetical protein